MTASISGTSGTWSHGGSVTISGSGFGSKSPAAPTVWDDCSGTDPTDLWSGCWPNAGGSECTYRTAQRSISMPHSRITKYMAGAHSPYTAFNQGYNVGPFKNRSDVSSFPKYSFWSFRFRCDDNWVFGGDDNFKLYGFSSGNGTVYNLPHNWYIEAQNDPFLNTSNNGHWHYNDDDTSPPTLNPSNGYDGAMSNPMAGNWKQVEIELLISDDTDGAFKTWWNGVLGLNYSGARTDNYAGVSGSNRCDGPCGYGGHGNSNNWRYFADIYHDRSFSRVVLGNNASYTSCTVREMQIPSAWADGSISATVNLGAFGDSGTAYLYVVDSTGAPSASHAITIGADEGGGSPIEQVLPHYAMMLAGQSPSVSIVSDILQQTTFRWRNDDGSEIGATWRVLENERTILPLNTPVRLRTTVARIGGATNYHYRLEYKKSTDSIWQPVLTSSGAVRMNLSTNIASSGEATTRQLTAPGGRPVSKFSSGRMWDDENGLDRIALQAGGFTELEWSIVLTSPAVANDRYNFRVTVSKT